MTVVDLYTIQIIAETDDPSYTPPSVDAIMGANVVRDILGEAEENLTDLLPAGYRARIRRWDYPDEGNDDE